MTERPTLKSSLKRGALLTAANWQVVLVQFVAEAIFKILLAVPIVGGAFLAVLLVGGDVAELLSGDLRDTLSAVAASLTTQPLPFLTFLTALAAAVAGGSAFVFLVKGGTVAVLAAANRQTGAIEREPLTLHALERAAAFSLDRLTDGCARYFRRYLRLGLVLGGVYVVSSSVYALVILEGFKLAGEGALLLGWTVMAAIVSSAFVMWITIVNLLYLLTQIAIASDDVAVRVGIRQVAAFLRADLREVAGVFGVVFVLVVLATAAAIVATAAFGLIAFIPLVWLAAVPLQAAAWLVRGLVFQYLGLTALGAYLKLYRSFQASSSPQTNAV